jgi:hypothetical protein
MAIIYYVDAIASGGKTYAAVSHLALLAELGYKIIFAGPTMDLLDECYKGMRTRFPDITCATIHSRSQVKKPFREILKFMETQRHKKTGAVLFMAQASLPMLNMTMRQGWHIVVDEVPPATESTELTLVSKPFRDRLKIIPMGPKYCLIKPVRDTYWKGILAGDKPTWVESPTTGLMVRADYTKFANLILKPHYDVWGITEEWSDGAIADKELVKHIFTELRPDYLEGFSGYPTVMGALIKDTLLYRLWTINHGVEWKENKKITPYRDAHDNGALLDIQYFSERNFSKYMRDSLYVPGSGSGTVLDQMFKAVDHQFGREPFGYMVNKDRETEVVKAFAGQGVKLPNKPHGLNCYQHLDNIAVFSALNLTKAHAAWLEFRGVSGDELKLSLSCQDTYQAIMRGSLRNESQTRKSVFVPDRVSAGYIHALFPGSKISRNLYGLDNEKPESKNRGRDVAPAEREKARREENRLNLQKGMILSTGLDFPKIVHDSRIRYTMVHDSGKMIVSSLEKDEIGMSLFENIYSNTPFGFCKWNSIDDFIALLWQWHQETTESKKSNILICPSIFDPELARRAGDLNGKGELKKRGRSAVVSSVGIWLDNDWGDMTKEQFMDLFPDLQMVICNSYSSTSDCEKWRVWIPTTCAMGYNPETKKVDLYMHITKQIRHKVENHGIGYRSAQWITTWYTKYKQKYGHYDVDPPYLCHGFDWSKTYPENLLYLPCQAATGAADSFFIDLRGGLRKPLNVERWISHPIIDLRPSPLPEAVAAPTTPVLSVVTPVAKLQAALYANSRQYQIDQAIATWKMCNFPEHRNAGWFNLAKELRNIGLTRAENTAKLRSEPNLKSDQKNAIDRIIKTLYKES